MPILNFNEFVQGIIEGNAPEQTDLENIDISFDIEHISDPSSFGDYGRGGSLASSSKKNPMLFGVVREIIDKMILDEKSGKEEKVAGVVRCDLYDRYEDALLGNNNGISRSLPIPFTSFIAGFNKAKDKNKQEYYGSYFVPNVGSIVLVVFPDNSNDVPIIIGCLSDYDIFSCDKNILKPDAKDQVGVLFNRTIYSLMNKTTIVSKLAEKDDEKLNKLQSVLKSYGLIFKKHLLTPTDITLNEKDKINNTDSSLEAYIYANKDKITSGADLYDMVQGLQKPGDKKDLIDKLVNYADRPSIFKTPSFQINMGVYSSDKKNIENSICYSLGRNTFAYNLQLLFDDIDKNDKNFYLENDKIDTPSYIPKDIDMRSDVLKEVPEAAELGDTKKYKTSSGTKWDDNKYRCNIVIKTYTNESETKGTYFCVNQSKDQIEVVTINGNDKKVKTELVELNFNIYTNGNLNFVAMDGIKIVAKNVSLQSVNEFEMFKKKGEKSKFISVSGEETEILSGGDGKNKDKKIILDCSPDDLDVEGKKVVIADKYRLEYKGNDDGLYNISTLNGKFQAPLQAPPNTIMPVVFSFANFPINRAQSIKHKAGTTALQPVKNDQLNVCLGGTQILNVGSELEDPDGKSYLGTEWQTQAIQIPANATLNLASMIPPKMTPADIIYIKGNPEILINSGAKTVFICGKECAIEGSGFGAAPNPRMTVGKLVKKLGAK